MRKKLTTKEFIQKAKAVHQDKYIYDEVKYINSKTKVKIKCPKHGVWMVTPANHLWGDGCNECGK